MLIIGERVNATRRPIAEAIHGHEEAHITEEIRAQDEAGAHYIDLNAGAGSGDHQQETADLKWLVDLALRTTEKKLSLDSSDPVALQKAIEHVDGRRPVLLNSVNGEAERLDRVLAIAAEHGCPVIALAMDGGGIPTGVSRRVAVCESILAAATKAGVSEENIYFDPLAIPVCNDVTQPRMTLDTLREI